MQVRQGKEFQISSPQDHPSGCAEAVAQLSGIGLFPTTRRSIGELGSIGDARMMGTNKRDARRIVQLARRLLDAANGPRGWAREQKWTARIDVTDRG